ncbi:MAG: hypothetical protein BMS9Abin19_0923 [Gammaproteobacteria bacterium]|nr:MAG: hypothetical protein BMS9Abin19_0923 [Gammaproteobacteria bacterium]
MNVKYYVVLVLSVLIVSCAANTKIIDSWVDAEHIKPYRHPMIIGISDSQQTRQIFEKHFVSELNKINITATASYKLINSKQKMNRETVIKAIQGTDIDSVIVTYLVSSETEVKFNESPLSQGYSGDVENNKMSATLVSTRGRTSSTEIVTLKNDLYDAGSKSLVWSTQTRSVAPASIDEVVTDVVALLISQMLSDGVIK